MSLKIKNLTPKKIAFLISLGISVIITIAVNLIWVIFHPFQVAFCILVLLSTFLVSYLGILWGIKKFIDRKFRLIYKTIHNLKVGLKKDKKQASMDEDIFGKINEAVIEWD